MSRPRINDWRGKLSLTTEQMEELYEAWRDDIDDKDESLETTRQELEDERVESKKPPEWGSCRRGCAPAYLDRDRFCSPACKLGAPRGEFVTASSNTGV